MIDSIVVFDGTSYFVEETGYQLQDGETRVTSGSFRTCSEKCDALNKGVYDSPRAAYM